MSESSHPHQNQLRDFVLGKLPDESLNEVASHLDACVECEATIASLDAFSDTLMTHVAKPVQPAAPEPRLAEVLRLATRRAPGVWPPAEGSPPVAPLGRLDAYELVAKLGEGGMGVVYKAMHTKLEKVVALKVLGQGLLTVPQAVARFEREMRAVGKLDHPHLVRAHDAGEVDGVHFLVMEYVAGQDLTALVEQHGPLPIAEACELVRQAALGLQCAHEHGLVHRDIKPSNLMLAADGRVKVLDLGLALLAGSRENKDLTCDGQIMGTLDYMAPEQAHSSHTVDIRADIYSLGATLYKLLSGHAPFASPAHDNPMKKLLALAQERQKPLSKLRPDVPQGLSSFVDRLLEKDPAQRPEQPIDVADALAPLASSADLATLLPEADAAKLRAARAGSSAAPRSPVRVEALSAAPPAAPPRRGRPAVLLGGLGGAAAILLGVWIIIRDNEGKELARVKAPEGAQVEIVDEATGKAKQPPQPVTPAKQPAPTPPISAGPPPVITPRAGLADKEKPFVIVRAKGGERIAAATLARAMTMRGADDVIEVFGNGPFPTGTVKVKGNLTLRAAPGYRPVFEGPLRTSPAMLAVEDGNLLVEGCDFRATSVWGTGGIFAGTGPAWEFRNCRMVGGGGRAIAYDGPHLRLVDCLMTFTTFNIPWIGLTAEKLQWEMENCVVRAPGHELIPLLPGRHWKVKLRHNTIIMQGTFLATMADRKDARLDVEAAGNIFQLNDWNHPAPAHLHTWKNRVTWRGEHNLYVGPREFLLWQLDEKGEKLSHGLTGWNEFWETEEPGSAEAQAFYPAWRQPFVAQEPTELVAAFEAYLAMQRAAQSVDFKSAGPDWRLVGPGEAYVRALAAQGTPVAEDQLRPKPDQGAPIAMIRQGKVVGAFDQLEAAFATAQDGDVVELRTDDIVPPGAMPTPPKPMALTIRAAPGYLPIIEGNAAWQAPGVTLTVEGLHFQQGYLFGGPEGSDCRLARLANCSSSADPKVAFNHILGYSLIPSAFTTEIVNCISPGNVAILPSPESRVVIRNSAVGSIVSKYPNGKQDHFIDVDHSLLWSPATFSYPVGTFFAFPAPAEGPISSQQITVSHSIMDSSSHLLQLFGPGLKAGWKGGGNAFALGNGNWTHPEDSLGRVAANLGGWQALSESDQDSVQIDPIIYNAQAWKLLPGTPGPALAPMASISAPTSAASASAKSE